MQFKNVIVFGTDPILGSAVGEIEFREDGLPPLLKPIASAYFNEDGRSVLERVAAKIRKQIRGAMGREGGRIPVA